MFDLILGWAVIILPTTLAVLFIFIPARAENEKAYTRWRYWLVSFGIGFSLLAWWQQSRATKAASKDRESAISETSARVATATADRVTKAMSEQYQGTISGLNQQIGTLQSELSEMRKASANSSDLIAAGISDTIKMQSGGDSFAYITFTPEPADLRMNGSPPSAGPQFLIGITSHGKYPLRDTHCVLMDDERRTEAMLEYNKHPDGNWIAAINSADRPYYLPYLRPQSSEAPTGEVKMLELYPAGTKDAKDLSVSCSSLNGYWNERLHLRKIDGKWHQALSLMGPTAKQSLHPFIYYDPDFPAGKELAEKDWVQPKAKHR